LNVEQPNLKTKLYKLRDGGALSLDIMPSGTKTWRYAYRIHGKQKTFTIGQYPARYQLIKGLYQQGLQ